jgi:hypothetical protein
MPLKGPCVGEDGLWAHGEESIGGEEWVGGSVKLPRSDLGWVLDWWVVKILGRLIGCVGGLAGAWVVPWRRACLCCGLLICCWQLIVRRPAS